VSIRQVPAAIARQARSGHGEDGSPLPSDPPESWGPTAKPPGCKQVLDHMVAALCCCTFGRWRQVTGSPAPVPRVTGKGRMPAAGADLGQDVAQTWLVPPVLVQISCWVPLPPWPVSSSTLSTAAGLS
jgi:hypothetical protein